QHWSYGLQPG
uniref:Gonadoliberin-1 n=1 Tax=Alligator mississippiensis TaxID=8496 RepID=GON1_ALLMI|nr:RecName: Full=Gonadoliberin-1; AltName: Full=Gonadoliberin I; AltName: Full=Gonadotropin-releasing hormone I; Short=GnRH-I; AltName: Full=LH-RH I; AltName: Full=Luliberin I [Alligator mississippiensis]